MGFFQGVVQQLNVIDERNERYGKELRDRAEKDADRAERRKERQDALMKSRTDALVGLAASGTISPEALLGYLSEVEGDSTAAKDTKGTKEKTALEVPKPSEKTLPGGVRIEKSLKPSSVVLQKGQDIIKKYGANPDTVAKFVARGPTHIDDLMDVLQARRADWVAAGREAEWESQGIANKIIEGVSVYVDDPSATVNREVLDRIDNLGLSSADRAYYKSVLSGKKPKSSFRSFDDKPTFFSLEEYDKANESFTKAITQTLLEAERKLQRNKPEDTASAEERREHGERLATIKRQIIDAKDGIVAPSVIEQYGPILFETFRKSVSPKISVEENLPGILGSSRRALNAVPEFDTIEEAREAVERGEARYDYPVRIGGQLGILERD